MNSADWYKLKERIYYWDDFEQWRDIYILEATKEDWNKWIDLINQMYSVEFYNGLTKQTTSAIDKNSVFDYMEHKTDLLSSAVIKVGQINVKCQFFSLLRIENDIDPREVKTAKDHESLMDYLKAISKKLGKPVRLTEENGPDEIFVIVKEEKVKVNFD